MLPIMSIPVARVRGRMVSLPSNIMWHTQETHQSLRMAALAFSFSTSPAARVWVSIREGKTFQTDSGGKGISMYIGLHPND
jgi:hypothetical protein